MYIHTNTHTVKKYGPGMLK